jgi:DNA-binding beta-propeller fold protein YncE
MNTRLRIAISLSVGATAVSLTIAGFASAHGGVSLAIAAQENALARIEPDTNAVGRVIGVAPGPSAVAVSRGTVWVYSDADRTVSEIDAATSRVRRLTPVSARPVDLGRLIGPMLAADAGGAWLVGIDEQQGPLLTRVPTGSGDIRTYALNVEPRGVAVGAGAVWVLGHRPGDNELIRLNKATGAVTGRTWFPDAGRVDSLVVDHGDAWVIASRTATLYRVDAHTMELGPHADLGQQAGRPRISGEMLWVGVSNAGGRTLLLDRRTLKVLLVLGCCTLQDSYDAVDALGSS